MVVKDKNMKAQLLNVIGILSVVVFIYFSIIFFKYESQMYKAKCECSEDIKRTVFKYYSYSIYVILVLQVLFIVFYILMVVYSSNQRGLEVVKENL